MELTERESKLLTYLDFVLKYLTIYRRFYENIANSFPALNRDAEVLDLQTISIENMFNDLNANFGTDYESVVKTNEN